MKNKNEEEFFVEIPKAEFQQLNDKMAQYDKQYDFVSDITETSLTGSVLLQLAKLKKENKI